MKKLVLFLVLVFIMSCGHVDNHTYNDDEGGDGDVALAGLSGADRSPWDAALPTGSHAIVMAANWTDPIGSLASIDLADPATVQTALVTTDSSDAVLQSFGGMVFVINRYGTDTIQVIDPSTFAVVGNYSVGAGSNPQDIYVYSSEKAYITRLDAHNDAANGADVLIVNPVSGELVGGIELKAYTADDGDRLARATQMVAVGNNLFVLMQDLPSNLLNPADAPGKVAVIDMTSDAVVGVIELAGRNPSDITYSPVTEKIYVVDTGVFNNFATDVNDPYGGIEEVDPVALQSEGIVIDDADFGDYLMHIRIAQDRAYTVVGGYAVASFDITTDNVISAALYVSPGSFLPDITVDGAGRVLVTERDMTSAGIVVLDGATGDVQVGSIAVGAMPAAITFVDIN